MAVAWAPTLTSSWRATASSVPWPVNVTKTGSASSASAGTSTVNTLGRGLPDPGADAVGRHEAARAALGVGGRDRARDDALGRLDLDVEVVAGQHRLVVQAAEALERGEPPDLLAPVRDGVVGQVEGAHRVQVGGDVQTHQPTAPSICSSMRRFSSRAYSIGSSLAIGSTKPRTIIAIASSSAMPRDIR